MCGIVIYSPALYRMFCAATGYGGTTQRVLSDSATISPKTVTVEFDSNVAPGLPWRFEPLQRNVTVHLGEQKLVFFTAENTGNEAMIGHATFNVTPQTSGIYFNKIQCFCFSEERLGGHGLMENRHGLLADACLTPADGHAERVAALAMIEPRADRPRAMTLGADKAYDAEDFVNELRSMTVTPHVAQNTSGRSSAIDARTTRHGRQWLGFSI